jgi:predicted glycoside hydrolase/deacetylase ChbG (UPF0249 family)
MNISICADDIGQDPAINDGCLELFNLGRLSQVSVLSQAPYLQSHRVELTKARDAGLQIGLHFNLTLAFEKSIFNTSLNQLILLSQLRLLDPLLIQKSLILQIDTFENTFQFSPDFIDGHQHVHQFPQIREVLIAEMIRRYGQQTPWVRSTVLPNISKKIPDAFKCRLLNILGGTYFLQLLKQHNIPHNHGFLGVYGFDARTAEDYQQNMQRWISLAQEDTLLMCHPANRLVEEDPIRSARVIEYNYLKSQRFAEDLNMKNLQIKPLLKKA